MRDLIKKVILDFVFEERTVLTPEDVKNESLKYNNRKDFRTQSPWAYRLAIKYNLFGNGINHLGKKIERNPPNFWTLEKAREEALKYTNRRDFQKGSPQAFAASKNRGWFDEITSHMDYLGSLYNRAVYAWEFPNNTVYIGLTDDLARREGEHLDPDGRTAVSKYMQETKLQPNLKLISDYTNFKEAQNIEHCSIDTYKSLGWLVLNKVKAGGLGACKRFWTKEQVEKEAKKYNTRSDFKKGNRSAYVVAVKEGWMDDITKHMVYKQIQWTPNMVYKIATNYDNFSDFRNNEKLAYHAAIRFNILDDVTKNMKRSLYDTSVPKFTNPEDIRKEYIKYKTIGDLRKNNISLYNAIRKFKMTDEVNSHFNIKPKTDWTLELLKSISSQYKNRGQLQKYNPSAYQQARKKGYLDILFPKL